jgi:hypothetical protein
MNIQKSQIKAARQERLKALNAVVSEAHCLSELFESKGAKSELYITEADSLIREYSALWLLEFIEKNVEEAGKILHIIMNANNDNEIGRYLSSLEVMKKVPGMAHRGKVDVFTRIGELGKQEGEWRTRPGVEPPVHAGYGSNLSSRIGSAPTATLEEGWLDKLMGRTEKAEPYKPSPSKLANAAGEVVGSLSKPVRSISANLAGNVSDLDKERTELTDLVLREEPKLVEFAVAYARFFTEENLGDEIALRGMSKRGLFGGSRLASLAKQEFGRVRGFNAAAFAKQISENPDLVKTNLELARRYYTTLTGLENALDMIYQRSKAGIGKTVGGFLSGFGGDGSMSTMIGKPTEE